jgi:hypothetical protein
MVSSADNHPPARVALLRWAARIGAVTAEALAEHDGCAVASARARLLAAERRRLLLRQRPLVGQPALLTLTPMGVHAAGLHGLAPSRVSAASAAHAIACAQAAAALERCYPTYRVTGERELRALERERGHALASARVGGDTRGAPQLHRPDLVLWPAGPTRELPVAVEIELTVKAPRRLLAICRAWARCRCVAGTLYLAPPEVRRALERAVAQAHAHERVVVLPLDALSRRAQRGAARIESTVAADA